jgi:hypothetical protein
MNTREVHGSHFPMEIPVPSEKNRDCDWFLKERERKRTGTEMLGTGSDICFRESRKL